MAYHGEYKGWSIFTDRAAGVRLPWFARRECGDGGHKLRADTRRGLRHLISDTI